jgi:hypothetical protein
VVRCTPILVVLAFMVLSSGGLAPYDTNPIMLSDTEQVDEFSLMLIHHSAKMNFREH